VLTVSALLSSFNLPAITSGAHSYIVMPLAM
jgi:hypothetical protein